MQLKLQGAARRRHWRPTMQSIVGPPTDTSFFSLGEKKEEVGGPPMHVGGSPGHAANIAGGRYFPPPLQALAAEGGP